jgi:hypothetical protein
VATLRLSSSVSPSRGQPGGKRQPCVQALQQARQLLHRRGADGGERALDRLLQLTRQRRGRGDRPRAAGDDQLSLNAEGPLAGRLVGRDRPHLVVDVVIQLIESDHAVLAPVRSPSTRALVNTDGASSDASAS